MVYIEIHLLNTLNYLKYFPLVSQCHYMYLTYLQISAVSELPTDRIEIAKSRGTFPGDVSVLDAHTTGLDWNPSACYLTSWPVYLDSGSIICYR